MSRTWKRIPSRTSSSGLLLPRLVGDEHFVHALAKVGAALLELTDPATILPPAKVISHSHDHHHAANKREKIRECENDGKFFEHKRPDEITVHMDHGGQDGNDGADHHFQAAV